MGHREGTNPACDMCFCLSPQERLAQSQRLQSTTGCSEAVPGKEYLGLFMTCEALKGQGGPLAAARPAAAAPHSTQGYAKRRQGSLQAPGLP